jgi:hypothetical protein
VWCLCGNVGKVRNAGMRDWWVINTEDQCHFSAVSTF